MIAIRCLREQQLELIRPLFERVFGESVSSGVLRWKYAAQRGESWGGWDGDALLIHCGLFFRDVLWQEEVARAAQLVDLMAAPKVAGLSRNGSPFTLLMQTLLTRLPRRDNPKGVAFGFPSARAMRLGELNGVYRSVGHWMALDFVATRCSWAAQAILLDGLSGPDVARLGLAWAGMRRDFSAHALGVRDAAFVQWRYLAHPTRRYRLLSIVSRWRRSTVGFVVLGPGDEVCEIVDLIGHWDDFPELLQATQHWWWSRGGRELVLMATAPFAQQLAPFAKRCRETEFRIMANPLMTPEALMRLQDQWWLTGGDTDYR